MTGIRPINRGAAEESELLSFSLVIPIRLNPIQSFNLSSPRSAINNATSEFDSFGEIIGASATSLGLNIRSAELESVCRIGSSIRVIYLLLRRWSPGNSSNSLLPRSSTWLDSLLLLSFLSIKAGKRVNPTRMPPLFSFRQIYIYWSFRINRSKALISLLAWHWSNPSISIISLGSFLEKGAKSERGIYPCFLSYINIFFVNSICATIYFRLFIYICNYKYFIEALPLVKNVQKRVKLIIVIVMKMGWLLVLVILSSLGYLFMDDLTRAAGLSQHAQQSIMRIMKEDDFESWVGSLSVNDFASRG